MKFEKAKLILEDMSLGTSQDFSFKITNTDVATDFAIDPCCGSCTVVYPPKTKIEQGEELVIRGVFTPSYSGELNKCIKLVASGKTIDKLWFQTKVV
jgi:hypothetical protein